MMESNIVLIADLVIFVIVEKRKRNKKEEPDIDTIQTLIQYRQAESVVNIVRSKFGILNIYIYICEFCVCVNTYVCTYVRKETKLLNPL